MSIRNLLKNTKSKKKRSSKGHGKRNSRRSKIETLENRQLMAADMIGVVRESPSGFDNWYMNSDNDSAHEIDMLYGLKDDTFFLGNWTGAGERTAVVRENADGFMRWLIDTDGDPTVERERLYGFNSDTPVVGDWNGDGIQDLGVARKEADGLLHWYLDTTGDPLPEIHLKFGLHSHTPIVGDWNRDGKDDIGTYAVESNGLGYFYGNTDNDVWAESIRQLGDGSSTPVTGDFDGDGKNDDIGIVNDNHGRLLHWQLDFDANGSINKRMDYGLKGDHVVVGQLRHAEANVRALINGRWQDVYDGSTRRHSLNIPGADLGKTAPWTRIQISNKGTESLRITNASIPNGFEVRGNANGSISPGRTRNFWVRPQSTTAGAKSGQISFRTNDGGENPYNFEIQSVIRAPEIAVFDGTKELSDGRSIVAFPASYHNQSGAVKEIHIKNKGTKLLTINNVQVARGEFTIQNVSATRLSPGQSAVVRVQANTRKVGTMRGELVISSNDSDEKEFNIHLQSRVEIPRPEISVFVNNQELQTGTAKIEFGELSVGASKTINIVIRNTGRAPLSINGINHPNVVTFSSQRFNIAAGGEYHLKATVNPRSTFTLNGHIELQSNDFDEPLFRIRATGQASVIVQAPEIQVFHTISNPRIRVIPRELTDGQRNAINLGSYQQRQTPDSRHFITIKNSGNAPLNVSRIRVPSGVKLIGNVKQVTPGGEARFEIMLDTSRVRNVNSDVQIYSNDANERLFNFQISGRVTRIMRPAEVEVRVNGRVTTGTANLDFSGLVGTQQSRIHRVTIRNRGDEPLRIFGVQSVSGYEIKGLREGQVLNRNQAVTVTIRVDQTLGTKIGTLRFATNDSDEGRFAINLRAKRYIAKKIATFDTSVHFRDYKVRVEAGDRIEIAPAHGLSGFTGKVMVFVNGKRIPLVFSSLTTLTVQGVNASEIQIDNWTTFVRPRFA